MGTADVAPSFGTGGTAIPFRGHRDWKPTVCWQRSWFLRTRCNAVRSATLWIADSPKWMRRMALQRRDTVAQIITPTMHTASIPVSAVETSKARKVQPADPNPIAFGHLGTGNAYCRP